MQTPQPPLSPSAPSASMLVVLDCDSTLIQDEVIELIAEAAGTRDAVAAITERAMQGELDFTDSLAERVATLRGVDVAIFEQVLAQVRVTPGAESLIAHVHEMGGVVGVVSGGFHEVLDGLGERLALNHWLANRLEVSEGKLTGRTVGEIVDGQVKARMLREWADQYGVPLDHTVAIGDGANDIPMMSVAGLSVAFNGKPKVREFAQLSIEHDLARVIPHLPK